MSIPGVAELLGLTIASEIGDISRFATARKLVGYSGLTLRITQSGQTSRIGRISKAGPTRCAGPPSTPRNRHPAAIVLLGLAQAGSRGLLDDRESLSKVAGRRSTSADVPVSRVLGRL